ncbi:hypothetical protein IEQ34_017841 [Dendrobium chrysotoxum]|uniref:Uncharacterized protein n=1 Tax=Dendrobium chrysotoxum TaxID=161865 RepID=A0AAV7GCK2_DENCH|nr:hypothetical protein IEQ34_017841 [Dendrobium chrysotoxum]
MRWELNVYITNNLNYSEGKADGGVGEGHDSGDNGKPPNLVEVRDFYLFLSKEFNRARMKAGIYANRIITTGPATQPSWAIAQANESTPEPITAVIM